jgi:hypothetical protein
MYLYLLHQAVQSNEFVLTAMEMLNFLRMVYKQINQIIVVKSSAVRDKFKRI